MTFVKVVEGSEIYNFPIHHIVHFSTIFGENRAQSRRVETVSGRALAASRRAATRFLGVWAARRPRQRADQDPCAPRSLEVRRARASSPFAPYARAPHTGRTAGPSRAPPYHGGIFAVTMTSRASRPI
jgi:hypothetical protein